MTEEIEIKINIDQKKAKEIENFFVPRRWVFERTYGFFSPTSVEQGIFPRVKVRNGHCIAGVKIKKKKDDKYFEREEYEFFIEEKTAISMWKALGFTKVRIFEKLRKIYTLIGNVEMCLDKLPFGIYIEIEGEKKEIERAIKRFGLENYPRMAKAYLKIADELGVENAIFGGEENGRKS